MKLDIGLFAGLKCNNRELSCFGQNEFVLDVPQNTTVGQLQDLLQLASDFPLVCLVNGLAQKGERILVEGDRIGIFPPVGGG